jgi:hypothetical protein
MSPSNLNIVGLEVTEKDTGEIYELHARAPKKSLYPFGYDWVSQSQHGLLWLVHQRPTASELYVLLTLLACLKKRKRNHDQSSRDSRGGWHETTKCKQSAEQTHQIWCRPAAIK